jgi:hypothetical protein
MKEWYIVFADYCDTKDYSKNIPSEYFCKNTKCDRLLIDISSDIKINIFQKKDFYAITQLSKIVVSKRLVSIFDDLSITSYSYMPIADSGFGYLEIKSIASIYNDSFDDYETCPYCGYPLSLTISKGVSKEGIRFFKDAPGYLIARSEMKIGDSCNARYAVFFEEAVVEQIKKKKLKGMIFEKCVH